MLARLVNHLMSDLRTSSVKINKTRTFSVGVVGLEGAPCVAAVRYELRLTTDLRECLWCKGAETEVKLRRWSLPFSSEAAVDQCYRDLNQLMEAGRVQAPAQQAM
ncbi:hypothetical protein HYH02_003846 [Chlamydomonas schloesseri]|uniref:Uncharacterized protein n=1 Tax=Chlamydomonas schloesseri TaxID=2026947 RepID=A0A836B9I7_9CHLO|nr:hypothetical protein HYH02_003846 [Chlamydomonas schloesseri]|eukprot:KAG2451239.1 hypothetical protein HYH02_003846 [Chlamydomonas schloesseri]